MSPTRPDVDFRQIRVLGGGQNEGFEEFCCQLARRVVDVPPGSIFLRYRGAGGDGGVECIWRLPNGQEWGWQAKYIFDLDKEQIENSVVTALELHPSLTQYTVCLPFDLTGPKRGRGGRVVASQSDRYEAYEQDWREMAKARGMAVEFVRWPKSFLLDALLEIDPTLGRLRFWFDLEQFGDDWFGRQVQSAAKAAEPRYTPELRVDVPIAETLEAFGRTPRWQSSVADLAGKLEEVAEDWEHVYQRPSNEPERVDFPDAIRATAVRLTERLLALRDGIRSYARARQSHGALTPLLRLADDASSDAAECLSGVTEAFEAKYEARHLDSPGWKQYMAEIQVSFPTHHVDTARNVIACVSEIQAWLSGLQGQLPDAPSLLITGPAGAGKTYAICDSALDRHQRGLRSIVFLGEQFSDGDPWPQMRELLGLPGDLSREALLAALEAAGETTGYPCILFIDALNETKPRSMWHTHLVRVLTELRRLNWVKLCVSCRSSLLTDVIAPNVHLPEVEHTGFEGVEFDAFRRFFTFYRLEVPSIPLLQPEFTNPLFLRLVCESLRDDGLARLPEGMFGITTVLNHMLTTKNRKLAAELDYDPREPLVDRAVSALVETMALHGDRQWLPWEEAKRIVESVHPSAAWSTSLFNALVRENLLAEDRAIDPQDGEVRDVVRFAFERMAEHLFVRDILAGLSKPVEEAFRAGGPLWFAVADAASVHEHAGVLEALAVQLPERFGVELPDAVPSAPDALAIRRAVIGGLIWRSPDSIGSKLKGILTAAIHDPALRRQAINALLGVGTREDHPLNADWFHTQLMQLPMPARDAFWCPFLHLTHGTHGSVDRLIRWALEGDPRSVQPGVARLWLTQLAWFCAASDRRVRDEATMGMVRLLEGNQAECVSLITRVRNADDEYVVERCLAACYGAMIRAMDDEAIKATATLLAQMFSDENLPKNAVIRDYARCILELAALGNMLPAGTEIAQFRPPYSSEWPIVWPDEAAVEAFQHSTQDLPKLYLSCMMDDFSRYSVQHALGDYEGLDLKAARRWIFQQVLEMGYAPGLLAEFDRYLLSRYGGGRARPVWAERIGKKYQWIALYRLIARVADHLTLKQDPWDPPPSPTARLQAPMERNIDPTVLARATRRASQPTWWAPIEYDHSRWAAADDDTWLQVHDIPNSAAMLEVRDPETDQGWLVLNTSLTWWTERLRRYQTPRRLVWLHLRSYLVPRDMGERCWRWLARQQLAGQHEPDAPQFHAGFLGEFPWGLLFRQMLEQAAFDRHDRPATLGTYPVQATAAWLGAEHEFDSYHEGTIGLLVPAPTFFDRHDLSWDGASGYRTLDGTTAFLDPSLSERGPSALLVNREFLERFLMAHGLALVWTAVSEKQCIDSAIQRPYLEFTHVHLLLNGALKHSSGITGPRSRGKGAK